MTIAPAVTTLRTTEIVAETCPQCGFAEAVCEVRRGDGGSRFTTCPRCGFATELGPDKSTQWKGYGVFVLQSAEGEVMAGTFPRPIPEDRVATVRARFQEMGAAVRYVSRWNDEANTLEVLLSQEA